MTHPHHEIGSPLETLINFYYERKKTVCKGWNGEKHEYFNGGHFSFYLFSEPGKKLFWNMRKSLDQPFLFQR